MSNKETNEDGNSKETFWESIKYYVYGLITLAFIILIIWWIIPDLCSIKTYYNLIIKDSEYITRGEIGDMFGVVNALFSGLAFAGMIITLIQQKEELSLQRKELSHTRVELKDQNKTMKRQRFENTFFNLMSLHQNITDNVEYRILKKVEVDTLSPEYYTLKGREVFKNRYLERYKIDFRINNLKRGDEKVKKTFSRGELNLFNHYLHSFDGILRFIDESDLLEDDERQQYSVMLRNTLSNYEQCIIFYYFTASDTVNDNWHKDMAEKYALFGDIDKEELSEKEHYDLFEPSAYGNKDSKS